MSVESQQTTLRVLTVLSTLGALVMFGFIVRAVVVGDFSNEGTILITMPWGLVSLVDIYLGLLLFSFWVLWREGFSKIGFFWVTLILILGNMLSCIYILKACDDAKGNINKFWLGQRLKESAD